MVAKAAGTAKDYRTVVAETTCGPGYGHRTQRIFF